MLADVIKRAFKRFLIMFLALSLGGVYSEIAVGDESPDAPKNLPVAYNVSAIRKGGARIPIILTASDPNSRAIIGYAITSQISPSEGILEGVSPNLSFRPNPAFNGVVTFTYRAINEDFLASEDAVATVYVRQPRALFITSNVDGVPEPGQDHLRQADRSLEHKLVEIGFGGRMYWGVQSITAADAEQYDLVIISPFAFTQDQLDDANVSVLTLSAQEFEHLGLATGTTIDPTVEYRITHPEHPLAANLAGVVAPFQGSEGLAFPTGLAPAAKVIATVDGNDSAPALFMFDKGSAGVNGSPLPESRIGFALPDEPGDAFDFQESGKSLFEAAVRQAIAKGTK
ncbi:MAG: Ig-like domain-containing protein [Oligoflexales bacterium]